MNAKQSRFFVVLALAITVQISALRAGIVINMVESGSDVVATFSGSINSLDGATLFQTGNAGMANGFRPAPAPMAFLIASTPGTIAVFYYNIAAFPTSFGTSDSFFSATSSTVTANMIFRDFLVIDQAYVLGTPVTGTSTWANQTFSSLSLTEGSYLWSWTGDSVTLNIGAAPSPVPEPSTWAAAALLVGAAGCVRWRKRAKVS